MKEGTKNESAKNAYINGLKWYLTPSVNAFSGPLMGKKTAGSLPPDCPPYLTTPILP